MDFLHAYVGGPFDGRQDSNVGSSYNTLLLKQHVAVGPRWMAIYQFDGQGESEGVVRRTFRYLETVPAHVGMQFVKTQNQSLEYPDTPADDRPTAKSLKVSRGGRYSRIHDKAASRKRF